MTVNNKITIITPTRNSETFLEETILSVITQAGDFYIDYIIIDGGSEDNTIDLLKKYESKIKSRVWPIFCRGIEFNWISGKDKNMYEALNKGFKRSKGNIMAYINSDDIIMTGAFRTVTEIFSNYKDINWITGRPVYLNSDGLVYDIFNLIGFDQKKISRGYYRNDYLYFIQQEGTFWTRDLWEKSGAKMSVDYKYAGDFELWLRFAKFSKLYTLHSSLGAFRRHSKQLTSNFMSEYYFELNKIKKIKQKRLLKLWFFIYKRVLYYLGNKINFKIPYLKYNLKKDSWIRIN